MKISTAIMPITAARTPARIESAPSDGPTVRSSRYLMLGRQCARAQDHGQILGLLLVHAAAADLALIANRLLDVRDFLHFVVEHHGEAVADVSGGEVKEALPAFAGQREVTSGWPFWSVVGWASRRSLPLTAEMRETRYHACAFRAAPSILPGIRIASAGRMPPLSCSAACSLGYGPPKPA